MGLYTVVRADTDRLPQVENKGASLDQPVEFPEIDCVEYSGNRS